MMVLSGEIHNTVHFGFCYFIGKYTANTDPSLVHVEHNLCRIFLSFVEETLQYMDDKLHRSVVVVQHKHLVH